MWKPRRLAALWASTACYRDNFTILCGRYPILQILFKIAYSSAHPFHRQKSSAIMCTPPTTIILLLSHKLRYMIQRHKTTRRKKDCLASTCSNARMNSVHSAFIKHLALCCHSNRAITSLQLSNSNHLNTPLPLVTPTRLNPGHHA
jgi:hypothetical protein